MYACPSDDGFFFLGRKEDNMGNKIVKWLLKVNREGEIDITSNELSRHVPINRMLDKVGFYMVDAITVNDVTYLCVFEFDEKNRRKTKILVSRIKEDEHGEGLIDMTELDRINMDEIIDKHMVKRNRHMC